MDKTKIDIISGFLGCGKTTFIKKIIEEASDFSNTVIIENEFGEVNIDGNLLRRHGVNVKEITAGCICCSVSGDFDKSIREIKDKFQPERIIIEPSGIGKLSDISSICMSYPDLFEINKMITILDITKYFMYLNNFGEFYSDQIEHSNTILFSRLNMKDKMGIDLSAIKDSIKELNHHVHIIDKEWNEFSSLDLLESKLDGPKDHKTSGCHGHILDAFSDSSCGCGHNHEDHDHHHGTCSHSHDHDSCGHDHTHKHSSDEFSNISIKVTEAMTEEKLENLLKTLDKDPSLGQIIRAKGQVSSFDHNLEFDYVPGEINISKSPDKNKPILVIIGKNLNIKKIEDLFCK